MKKNAKKVDKRTTGLTTLELNAMKERIQELNANKTNGEKDVLAAIAKMEGSDRAMGKRIHTIIMDNAPNLLPRTWYGMPAYAKGDKVICFFQNAGKFKARYSTLGFSDKANLDEGKMWPTAFALKELNAKEEAMIIALIKKAVK